jgi:Flp pilus assembly protein TadB
MHSRREVWGDDPGERDASDVVAEIEAGEPSRRWHEHPAFVPIKAVGRFIGRNGRRLAITIVGFAVLLAGVAMILLPGPGWAAIFLGLAILSTEYVWARRLLKQARVKFGQAKDAVFGKGKPKGAPADDPPE